MCRAADDLAASCLRGALHKGNNIVVSRAADDLAASCIRGDLRKGDNTAVFRAADDLAASRLLGGLPEGKIRKGRFREQTILTSSRNAGSAGHEGETGCRRRRRPLSRWVMSGVGNWIEGRRMPVEGLLEGDGG